MSGPNETPQRSRQIIATLERRCGPGGYNYIVGLDPTMGLMSDYDEAFDD